MNEQSSANQPFNRREARRQRRSERLGDPSSVGTDVLGLILILLGGAFLLQNLGIFSISFTNCWALFILLPAIGSFQGGWRIYQQAGNRITAPASASLLVGLVLLMVTAVFLFNLNWSLFGPALLILGGIGTLLVAITTSR